MAFVVSVMYVVSVTQVCDGVKIQLDNLVLLIWNLNLI